MMFKLRMITPEKRGIGRRIKKIFISAGANVLSLVPVREMRGMNEMEARITVPSEDVCKEAVAGLGRIPGIAVLDVRLEAGSRERLPAGPTNTQGVFGPSVKGPGTESHV